MKTSHGTDFSRMMRSMHGPRQVGCFAARVARNEELVAPSRVLNEMVTRRNRAAVFARSFASNAQGANCSSCEISFPLTPICLEEARALRNMAQMNDLKSQLIKLVDEEIKESQEELDFCDAYLSTSGFKVYPDSLLHPEDRADSIS